MKLLLDILLYIGCIIGWGLSIIFGIAYYNWFFVDTFNDWGFIFAVVFLIPSLIILLITLGATIEIIERVKKKSSKNTNE